jgi:hypothetical protein
MFCGCVAAGNLFHLHFPSLDLNEFDANLQVKPGDVCSQVGLCSMRRDQSKRSGILPYCLLPLFAVFTIFVSLCTIWTIIWRYWLEPLDAPGFF